MTVLGVGVDAVDVERFRALLERRPAIKTRMFTEAELDDVGGSKSGAARLAVRFAAKEATMKALGRGIGACRFLDIEVVRSNKSGSASGAPSLRLARRAGELARAKGVDEWHVSLTHTQLVAIAVVTAEAAERGPGSPRIPPGRPDSGQEQWARTVGERSDTGSDVE
ncbi:MAG: holo-ACP synthase [Acidimicrobiales bacterium]